MSYQHIENLYRPRAQFLLLFKECYAMEKIHGTSARVNWDKGQLTFSSGGASHNAFSAIFDEADLQQRFVEIGHDKITVYGEAYGGKMQGMSHTYGPDLRFIVFDIKLHDQMLGVDGDRKGNVWLNVPQASHMADRLGMEFVPFVRVSTDLAELDRQRDLPSELAERRGIKEDKMREGLVIRPIEEFVDAEGERVIAKHKRPEFSERQTPPDVSPEKLKVLQEAEAIALEWVTDMRLDHVLDKLGNPKDMTAVKQVIDAMVKDIYREASGEIVESAAVEKAIARATSKRFKGRLLKSMLAS